MAIFLQGSKYEGSWENDRINGEGTSWYNNGNKYHGEWLNGRINGMGTLFLASGDRYSGDWKDGRRHGQGTYFYWWEFLDSTVFYYKCGLICW